MYTNKTVDVRSLFSLCLGEVVRGWSSCPAVQLRYSFSFADKVRVLVDVSIGRDDRSRRSSCRS